MVESHNIAIKVVRIFCLSKYYHSSKYKKRLFGHLESRQPKDNRAKIKCTVEL